MTHIHSYLGFHGEIQVETPSTFNSPNMQRTEEFRTGTLNIRSKKTQASTAMTRV